MLLSMRSPSFISRTRWPLSATSLVLLALSIPTASAQTSNFFQSLCASFNTGTGTQKSSSDFMSNGNCHDQCSGFAYAIVQYQDCWCSNVQPGGAGPGSNCNVDCPGFPQEKCGDKSQGLFGYIALGPAPSSTQGGSQPTSNAVSSASFPRPVTVQDTVTPTPSVQTLVISVTPSTTPTPETATQTVSVSVTPSSRSSSSKTSSTTTWSPTPVMTVETVTGVVRTLTVTPSEPPAQTQTVVAQSSNNNSGGFFSSPGKVAGTFVAVAIIIVALIAGLILFLWRRRRRSESEHLPSVAGSTAGTPQRRPSRMSSMGLLGSQKEKYVLPSIQTSGWGPGTSAEKSPNETLDKRSSYPHVTDQRLEPTAVWNPLHDNGSHVSVRSFRDDQDYSRRMLRVANPD